MKKYAPYLLIALFAVLLWDVFDTGMHVNFDGEEFDGPFGALFGMLLAGGGTLLGLLVMMVVGVVLAVALVWYLVSRSRKARLAKPVAA